MKIPRTKKIKRCLLCKNKNLKFTSDLKEGVAGSDCLMTDVWLSMGEKDTKKKSNFKNYTIDKQKMYMNL